MEVMFFDAAYTGKVKLNQATLDYITKKKYRKIGLYASVQFCNQLAEVEEQLHKLKLELVTSQPDRTHVKGQLLGCDNYHNSLNLNQDVDCYLYVGDGRFHPLALVYLQKDNPQLKEVICNDPISNKMTLMGVKDIETILKKYRGSLIKFLSADIIGVISTIKPGQEQLRPSFQLEKKYPGKKFYYFIDNTVSFDNLENFNFIEVWVNTACPRIGFDDQEKFLLGVINLNDALEAKEILSQDSLFNRQ